MSEINYSKEKAVELYQSFDDYEKFRTEELKKILKPYIDVTNEYGKILSRICLLIGHIKPKDKYEKTQRDLFADVFDHLYETRNFIINGKYYIAYPLARKAFESLTLKIAFYLDSRLANKWENGIQIHR